MARAAVGGLTRVAEALAAAAAGALGLVSACGGGAAARPDAGQYQVTVRFEDHHFGPDGETLVAADLAGRAPSAYVERDDGVFEEIEHAPLPWDDGAFRLRFPDGRRWLRAGNDWLAEPPADVDLGALVSGRPDATLGGLGASVRLVADGLAPWVDGDDLTVVAPSTYGLSIAFDEPGLPAAGGQNVDLFFSWRYRGLVDARLGDVLVAEQRRRETQGLFRVWRVVSAFRFDDFVQSPGLVSSLAASFTPPPEVSLTLDVRQGDFVAAGAGATPALTWLPYNVDLSFGMYGAPPDDAASYAAVASAYGLSSGAALAGTITVGDPFPPEWPRWVYFEAYSFANYRLDGTSETLNGLVRVGVRVPVAEATGGPLVPLVQPPRELRLDGADASGPLVGVAEHAVLSWTAPEGPAPAGYEVTVYRLVVVDAYTLDTVVGRLHTRAIQVRLPPGFLDETGQHFIVVRALVGDELDLAGAPRQRPGRLGFADAVTGPFSR